jgi:cytochrome c
MPFKFPVIIFFACLFLCCLIGWLLKARQAENHAPKVVITKPSPKDAFTANSLIPYEITITDQEDGNSAFDEIAANEVLLKISYLTDSANVNTYIVSEAKSREASGLTLIKTVGCFNCHAVKNKLIGPSFEAIAKKYANNARSVTMLANKVINGSASVWGTEKMPPHPDLKTNQSIDIINWIMKSCSDPNTNYLPGLTGSFVSTATVEKNAGKGVCVLTASYTDHGLPQMPLQHKEGRCTIVIKSSEN